MLVGECWIVNRQFASWYTDPKRVDQQVIDDIQERGRRHNELLKSACATAKDPDSPPFLYLVESATEIGTKLQAMLALALEFRKSRRSVTRPEAPESPAA